MSKAPPSMKFPHPLGSHPFIASRSQNTVDLSLSKQQSGGRQASGCEFCSDRHLCSSKSQRKRLIWSFSSLRREQVRALAHVRDSDRRMRQIRAGNSWAIYLQLHEQTANVLLQPSAEHPCMYPQVRSASRAGQWGGDERKGRRGGGGERGKARGIVG